MAVETSERYKDIIYSGGATYSCHLIINDTPISPSLLSSIQISSPSIDTSDSTFHLGNFISQQLKIKFHNISEIDIQSGYNVTLSISVDVDGEPETIKIGEYYIDELAENYQKTNEITCLDYASKMLAPINYKNAIFNYQLTQDTTILEGKTYYYLESGSTWKDYVYKEVENPIIDDIDTYYEPTTSSITLSNLLQYICDYYDIVLGSYPEINNDIETGAYDSTISGKQYVSWIAEMFGGNAKMNREGILEIYPINLQPVTTINAMISKNIEVGEYYKISKVTYFDANRNFSTGTDDNNTLIIRQGNLFVNDQENIDNIYEQVNGFEVYSLLLENRGDISLDSWDLVTIEVGDKSYPTLNSNDITYNGVIMTKINCQIPTKQQEVTTNNYYNNIPDAVRKVYSEIDNINYQIRFNASNTYTKEEIRKIAKGESLETERVEVTYVATEQGIFDDSGLTIQKINPEGQIISDTTGLFNEVGVTVRKVNNGVVETGNPILFSGYVSTNNSDYEGYEGQTLTATQNLKVDHWIEIGTKSRIEEFDDTSGGTTTHKTGMFPLE